MSKNNSNFASHLKLLMYMDSIISLSYVKIRVAAIDGYDYGLNPTIEINTFKTREEWLEDIEKQKQKQTPIKPKIFKSNFGYRSGGREQIVFQYPHIIIAYIDYTLIWDDKEDPYHKSINSI